MPSSPSPPSALLASSSPSHPSPPSSSSSSAMTPSPSPLLPLPVTSSSSHSPPMSKSAKRRARQKLADAYRAQQQQQKQDSFPPLSRYSPPPRSLSLNRTPPAHMQVHYARAQHSPSPLQQLTEMFPAAEPNMIESAYVSCNRDFAATMEMLLQSDQSNQPTAVAAPSSDEDRALQVALAASVISAAEEGVPIDNDALEHSRLALLRQPDHFSRLPLDSLHLITDCLSLFDLASLLRVNNELNREVSRVLHRIDRLDFSRERYGMWSDRRILSMIARFPATHSLSLRGRFNFRSFDRLRQACFGMPLRHLSLAQCMQLQDIDCNELFGLESLHSLDLCACDITDDGLEFISTARRNSNLIRLQLADCKFISNTGVSRIVERCQNLESLDLRGTNVTPAALQFNSSATKLTHLNMQRCKRLPATVTFNSPYCILTQLNISANLNLKHLTLGVPTLTALNVSNCKQLTTLSLHTPQLATLNLSGCLSLSHIGPYAAMSESFQTSLTECNVNLCRSITALSFQRLLSSAAATIQLLSCKGCILLTDANLALLVRDDATVSAETSSHVLDASSSNAPASSAHSHSLAPHLSFVDCSGCKSVSTSMSNLVIRMVEEQRQRCEEQKRLQEQHDDIARMLADNGVRHQNGRTSAKDPRWIGGLDDDEK